MAPLLELLHAWSHPRNEITAFLGEFFESFMFLFMASTGTQIAVASTLSTTRCPNMKPPPKVSKLLESYTDTTWVTLDFGLVKAVSLLHALHISIVQVLASMCAAGVVSAIQPDISKAQGLFPAMFLTAQFVLTICMLAVEKHKAAYIAPVGIGLALFVTEMAGAHFTGGTLNPARSFGPCIYWVGPCLGACVAAGVYRLVKWLGYESTNPGQDDDGVEKWATQYA
ncbi:aquaporin-like protein [Zopfia rhizophila CBS 207.26]|uniref:Aquaporin-like protein n=1 Tax=Zopfia rhizophila CBS 207.26 TaxID=1314779 RepID=A0A6A6DNB4_9PEZI|nr:aquaporin-like protein [Zopfia rhizophila CBS 207.26]